MNLSNNNPTDMNKLTEQDLTQAPDIREVQKQMIMEFIMMIDLQEPEFDDLISPQKLKASVFEYSRRISPLNHPE